jgi:AraC family transcriptional regulator of adaptative response/methylated-DNA-[protein]-cysteine methyltransferase
MNPRTAYQQIESLIRYLDEHQAEQPDLATLARQARLSPFHLHRVFAAWAGVTPKDFLQCLTVADVRRRLAAGASALETALDTGLSGPGRLHDLCVSLEAASPGEIRSGGEGWTIEAGFAHSPFGRCLIAESPRGLCDLTFIEPGAEARAWAALQTAWPRAALRRADRKAANWAHAVFETAPRADGTRPLRAYVRGSEFQVKVWRALLRIPRGAAVTYGRLASALGQPTAARAVGSAVGKNAIGYLIPCHRVIRETGVIGDYRWGAWRKRAMLVREALGSGSHLA